MNYNPTLKEFQANREDLTLLGLWWAMCWRAWVVMMCGYAVLAVLGMIISSSH